MHSTGIWWNLCSHYRVHFWKKYNSIRKYLLNIQSCWTRGRGQETICHAPVLEKHTCIMCVWKYTKVLLVIISREWKHMIFIFFVLSNICHSLYPEHVLCWNVFKCCALSWGETEEFWTLRVAPLSGLETEGDAEMNVRGDSRAQWTSRETAHQPTSSSLLVPFSFEARPSFMLSWSVWLNQLT